MNKLQSILCSVFIFIAIVINAPETYAKNVLLDGVIISGNPNEGYDVILDTKNQVKYTTQKISDNKIILNLKNMTPTSDAKAIYKNAVGLEYVLIKPSFNGTTIEISGQNTVNNEVLFPQNSIPYKENNWGYAVGGFALLLGILGLLKTKKNRQFSAKISVVDEENKILKVALESKDGLIVRPQGAKRLQPQKQNIRKVNFDRDYDFKTVKIK